jgi:outer membrane protein
MRIQRVLVGFALSLLLAIPAGAQESAPPEKTDVLKLSIGRTIELALKNNLNVVIARLGYESEGELVGQAKGAYSPLFSVDFNNQRSVTQGTSQLSGAQTLTNISTGYNFSWQQQLPTGGNYFVTFDNRRASTNNTFTSVNPRYDAAISAQITQPLLADRQLNSIKQRIVVAQNGERVARHDFESQVMDLVTNVQSAYWDWVYSIRDQDVNQKALELAQDLLRNNQIQVQVGTMAPIDVLEAQAEVAARQNDVILSEEAVERNADRIRAFINDPNAPDFWVNAIEPIDEPELPEIQIDLDEAVRTALARRPELAGARVDLDTRNFNVRYTRNQMLPRVDLVGSYALAGLGGDRIVRSGLGGDVTQEIPGGYNDALDQLFAGDYPNWTLGLNFSYPIGNSSADAAHAQAQVDYRRQRAVVENQEISIAQQVRVTARLVETGRKAIDATRAARELAQQRLEAEQKKFEVGMSTSFLIVQAQRDLAVAAGNELQAVTNYNKSVVAYRRVTGTILDDQNIEVR